MSWRYMNWRYMNLCGMCSDPQNSAPVLVLANHGNKSYDMHSVQRVGCILVSLSTIYLWMYAWAR